MGETGQRAVIYARISQDRAGSFLGVERQLDDCRELAQRHGWKVVSELSDNDISAYSGKRRPSYEELLRLMAAGTVDFVIAWHTDRLHRAPVELERYIDLSEQSGIPTHTVRAGDLDLSTAAGRMIARILGATARHESEQKSERIRRKRRQEAQNGALHGSLGYGWSKTEAGWTVNEDQAKIIREAAERLLAGETLGSIVTDFNSRNIPTPAAAFWTHRTVGRVASSKDAGGASAAVVSEIRSRMKAVNETGESAATIAADLRERGVPTPRMFWRSPNLRQLLMAARLCGWREWSPGSHSGRRASEMTAQGDWPPILTKPVVERIRSLLMDPARSTWSQRKSAFLLSGGLLICAECRSPMSGRVSGGAVRYSCSAQPGLARCGSNSILGAPVEDGVREAAIKRLAGSNLSPKKQRAPSTPSDDLLSLIVEANSMKAEIMKDRVRGNITASEWAAAREVLEEKIQAAARELEGSSRTTTLAGIPTTSETEIRKWWSLAGVERQRATLHALMTGVVIAKGRRGGFTFDADRIGLPIWRA